MKKLIFITILIFSSTSLKAEAVIIGSVDCGLWLKAREESTSLILEAAAQGFLNGYATGTMQNIWFTPTKITPTQAFYYVDNYCKKNPLSDMNTGLMRLIESRGHYEHLRNLNK